MAFITEGEREFRYIATRMWIKIVLFLVPAAFFFGAEFGKRDTFAQHRALIGKLDPVCEAAYERLLVRALEDRAEGR